MDEAPLSRIAQILLRQELPVCDEKLITITSVVDLAALTMMGLQQNGDLFTYR